jgi:hypothetical protein
LRASCPRIMAKNALGIFSIYSYYIRIHINTVAFSYHLTSHVIAE